MIRFLITGHVDHGKSTLSGRLLYQCDVLDKRNVQKVFDEADNDKMSSFKWARLLDTNSDEKERGVTVECNEIDFKYQDKDFKLIDTPGHKMYIRNLIDAMYRNVQINEGNRNESEISGCECTETIGVLVLSALPNELQGSLTHIKENILLMKAIGINSIIVVINKLDKVNWDRSYFETAKKAVSSIIKSARYKQIKFCACSGIEGIGIIDRGFKDVDSLMETLTGMNTKNEMKRVTNEMDETRKRKNGMDGTCVMSEPKETVTISANIFILYCKIFSAGYEVIIHMNYGEFLFVVDKVEKIPKDNKPFIKSGDLGKCTLTLKDNKERVFVKVNDRIVMRSNDKTVGYGLVI